MATSCELLVIGGRSGVGKSTAAEEISALLEEQSVSHCLIDGDNLDWAHPKPSDDPHGTALTERNLHSMWQNYASVGYTRLIYVNTMSVAEVPMLVRAMGGTPRVTAVLLRSTDAAARSRLEQRELPSRVEAALLRSQLKAKWLDDDAPSSVHRVDTDDATAAEVARRVLALTGWTSA